MKGMQKILGFGLLGVIGCSTIDEKYPVRSFNDTIDDKRVDYNRETNKEGNLVGVVLGVGEGDQEEIFVDKEGDGAVDQYTFPIGGQQMTLSSKDELYANVFAVKQREFEMYIRRINDHPYQSAEAARKKNEEIVKKVEALLNTY